MITADSLPGLLALWPFGPGGISAGELLIVGFVALLLFGRRLPEVARSMGKSIVEFKKGLKDVKQDIDDSDGPEVAPPRLERKSDMDAVNSSTPVRDQEHAH